MRAASIQASTAAAGPRGSRRLLALAGDERLVEQIRRGNEAAFEVAFERHGPAILGFCRHMLGSPEEAEDAVQHTFAAAHRDLLRDSDREITLKPWLFTIARNRCLSMLRARRELPIEHAELATAGLAEQVEQRAELRQLLADLGQLPDEQRAALLLAELGGLSHNEVARVLGCEVARVKALVFRARSGLIQRREAREIPCEGIQEQLATLRGGALRRTELRLHLRGCAACRAYRDQVRHQRQLLAAALPVAPSLALKSSVLTAVGIGGGSAGGGVAAGLTSIAGALTGAAGSGVLAKVAVVGVLAGGGAVAGQAVLDPRQHAGQPPHPPPPSLPGAAQGARREPTERPTAPVPSRQMRRAPASSVARRGRKDNSALPTRGSERSTGTGPTPVQAKQNGGRALGHSRKSLERTSRPEGKPAGPLDGRPASTPVRRGPPEPKTQPRPRHGPPRRQRRPAPKATALAATKPTPRHGPRRQAPTVTAEPRRESPANTPVPAESPSATTPTPGGHPPPSPHGKQEP